MNGCGMLKPVSGDLIDFYELITDIQYTDDMGLDLGIEQSHALFIG